jgi:hypothetical protein
MNCIIACFPISPFLSNEKLFRCSILEVGELLDAKRRGTHQEERFYSSDAVNYTVFPLLRHGPRRS